MVHGTGAVSEGRSRHLHTNRERDGCAAVDSSIAGGTPIQLTNDDAAEFPGSWSPDGAYFAYYALRDGNVNLMKVKTTGQADAGRASTRRQWYRPRMVSAGDWIVHGSELVSPDGQTTKALGDPRTPAYVFSQDGKLLYGLRLENDRQVLYSIEIATGAEKVIGTARRWIHTRQQSDPVDPLQPLARRQELRLRQRDVHDEPVDARRIREDEEPFRRSPAPAELDAPRRRPAQLLAHAGTDLLCGPCGGRFSLLGRTREPPAGHVPGGFGGGDVLPSGDERLTVS